MWWLKKTPKREKSAEELKAEAVWRRANVGGRDWMESLVVAIILALLFRGFIAEVFIIPTGSMAPTLTGSHKDLKCPECGYRYQTGASVENPNEDAPMRAGKEPTGFFARVFGQSVIPAGQMVIGSVCPNCRAPSSIDLTDPNQQTFNGDRILVSKFLYSLQAPQRWDVLVFLQPKNYKQPFIKRLLGVPNETLRIEHGDAYSKPTGADSFAILRKPASKQLAMSQVVYDWDQVATELLSKGWPSRWQPWQAGALLPPTNSWQVTEAAGKSMAMLPDSAIAADANRIHTLRYFHRLPTQAEWAIARQGGSLAAVPAYRGQLISDFYAYNANILMMSSAVYDGDANLRLDGNDLQQRINDISLPRDGRPASGLGLNWGREEHALEGDHWVGDLMIEGKITCSTPSGMVRLELVESGMRMQADIDLATGKATMRAVDGDAVLPLGEDPATQVAEVSGATALRGDGKPHRLRFGNYDDQLRLWVDDGLVAFDGPTTYDGRSLRPMTNRLPKWTAADPLDAAPASIGVRGTAASVEGLRILRDIYYIAVKDSNSVLDYNPSLAAGTIGARRAIFAQPDRWATSPLWQSRRSVEFVLKENQFFPMGDNSPESSDARIWDGPRYVERDLLKGKALVIIWPHGWPVGPLYVPNFQRMGLIR
jgi:signal peptidase I